MFLKSVIPEYKAKHSDIFIKKIIKCDYTVNWYIMKICKVLSLIPLFEVLFNMIEF